MTATEPRPPTAPDRAGPGTDPDPGAPTGWSLTPGTRLLWRGDGTVQLERLATGVVVSGLDRVLAAELARRAAAARRIPAWAPPGAPTVAPVVARHVEDVRALHRLAALGFVRAHPAAPTGPAATDVSRRATTGATVPRVLADHLAVGHRRGVPAAGVLEGRGRARVVVHGITRVSAYLGAMLAASGVGHVSFAGSGVVRVRDLLPGGLGVADEGRRFAVAAAEAVLRAAPEADVAPLGDAEPDLVLVCADAPVDPELRELLHRRRSAHLPVHLDAVRGELGPLVLPGLTACLRCADLHRLDHDPAWSLLAVQLQTAAATAPPAEPGLAARVGSLAAALALRYLDGDHRTRDHPGGDHRAGDHPGGDHPSADHSSADQWREEAGDVVGGSWELRAGWHVPRRRTRLPHPECGCRAAWGEPLRGAVPTSWSPARQNEPVSAPVIDPVGR